MPVGANAVVKVEDTSATGESGAAGEKTVAINASAAPGGSVRPVGCDMAVGEVLLAESQLLGPAEIGLLASVGATYVKCFKRPVVGVMSTGNELVDPWVEGDAAALDGGAGGSKIRDSNRAALLSSLGQTGAETVDLGIVKDSVEALRGAMLDAVRTCDVVVTSGGVSMGEKDLVKPMLEELGEVRFGRLKMKPGKPTIFAVLPRPDCEQKTLFFGLPGNAVSCLVSKALMIDPCLRRLQVRYRRT
jgi:gephyrin